MGVRKKGKNYFIDYYAGPKRYREMVGPNKRAAETALGKRLSEIKEGKFFPDRKTYPETKIEELSKRFKEWANVHRKGNDYKTHVPIIEKHFKGRILTTITQYEVESFRKLRMDTPTRHQTPRKASTLNRELSTLARMFSLAVSWGLVERNPAAKVKALPEPHGRTRFLSVEETGNLLNAATGHLRPILIMALETGMRRGEIMNLKWPDVDMRNGMVFVAEPKNGSSRHVPMSNRLRATLAALPRRLKSDHVFTGHIQKTPASGKRKRPLNQPIGKVGEHFNDVRTSFANACKKAGITGFRFHDLRHTAASHMVMAGVPIKTVGEILGHKTATMTERYSHLTPEHKREAVEILSRALQGKEGGFNRAPIGHQEGISEKGLREASAQPLERID